ncbi:hypothetical protein BGX27_011313 [Mortierella sp. AM989]|nr:hypothetical protein BGX27_011313 [Mortierella sp. AM989]
MADASFDFLGEAGMLASNADNPSTGTHKEEEDAFSAAVSVWRGIQLPTIQNEMDKQHMEILEQQKQSLAERKKLAELTREFKKIPDQEKLQQFKILLKAYQGEIDSITKREKATSQAFSSVCNTLGQAPDPAKLLQVAADQTTKLEEINALQTENIRLKEENASLSKQTANLRSMSSNATKLQQRLTRLEAKQEETIQERVKEKEQAFREEWEEKIRSAKETEHDLQRQLSQAKDQLRTLDSTQATLVDHSQKYEEEVVAKLAELDIVLLDYERANSRISELEGQNELLRSQMDAMQGGGIHNERAATLEQTIENQDAELQTLTTALENLKTSSKKQLAELERKRANLQREVQEKTDEIEATKRKLEQYKDYDSVKNELEILKYIEFSGSRGGDADDDWDERVLTLASKNLEKPIEVLSIEKNRKLENELTELKVAHGSITQELEEVRIRHEVATRQLDSQTQLIQRLEEDITRLNSATGGAGVGGSGVGGVNGYYVGGPGGNQGGFPHPTSPPYGSHSFSGEIVGGVALGPVLPATPRTPGFPSSASLNPDGLTPGVAAPTTSSADHSILPIVTSQRDRFRQRNSELEEQLRQQSEQISNLRNDNSQLQKDNLKMYEKVKYMQSYRDDSSGSGVGVGYSAAPSAMIDYASPFRNNSSSVGGGGSAGGGVVGRSAGGNQYKKNDGDEFQMQSLDPTDRYRNMYEESMNPFEAFHKKEESRRFNNMTPADKAMLTMSRLILTNKWTRSMLVAYTMGLHFLIVVMLYKMSAWEECRHDHETPNDANPMLPSDD